MTRLKPLLAALLLAGNLFTAMAQAKWTVTSPPVTSKHLNSVTWTGSQAVAVGEGGIVLTSPDGKDWTTQESFTKQTLNKVAWLDGKVWAVGDSGIIANSADGIKWTWQSIGPNYRLNSITRTDSIFVVVGGSSEVWSSVTQTSKDGVTWVGRNTSIINTLHSVTWTGKLLVSMSNYTSFSKDIIYTSPDGITWTVRRTASESLSNMVWTGSQLVAVGASGLVITSPDGITWTKRNTGTEPLHYGITWTGKQLVSWNVDWSGGTISTSLDGITWKTAAKDSAYKFVSVTSTGSRLIAVGYYGCTAYSADELGLVLAKTRYASMELPQGWKVDTAYAEDEPNGLIEYPITALNRTDYLRINGIVHDSIIPTANLNPTLPWGMKVLSTATRTIAGQEGILKTCFDDRTLQKLYFYYLGSGKLEINVSLTLNEYSSQTRVTEVVNALKAMKIFPPPIPTGLRRAYGRPRASALPGTHDALGRFHRQPAAASRAFRAIPH